jgi:hypothetical protein
MTTLVDKLYCQLRDCCFTGELLGCDVMMDPFVAIEAQHHANIYFKRCKIATNNVQNLLQALPSCDSDSDSDSDSDGQIDNVATIGMLALNDLLDVFADQPSDSQRTKFMIHKVSLYQLILQCRADVFDQQRLCASIAEFDQGRLALLLCEGLARLEMRSQVGNDIRDQLMQACRDYVSGCLGV